VRNPAGREPPRREETENASCILLVVEERPP
jgi:hypothetical protein